MIMVVIEIKKNIFNFMFGNIFFIIGSLLIVVLVIIRISRINVN